MLTCRTQVRESAAQWNLDALVGIAGRRRSPLLRRRRLDVFHRPAPNTGTARRSSGTWPGRGAPPSSPRRCKAARGGEDEDGEFAFTGSMLSATWEFPKERRGAVLASIRGLFGLTDGPS